jgi:hypothetical protein
MTLCIETQILLSGDLNYIGTKQLEEIRNSLGDIERMLKHLIESLENKCSTT